MGKFVYVTPPENFSPKVEVATCFCQVGDKILLLQRNEDKILGGTWVLPGGKIDAGETPKAAMRREVLEETGISLPEKDTVFLKKVFVRGKKLESFQRSIEIDFILHIFKVALPKFPDKIQLNENEHQDCRWVTPQQALKMQLLPGQDEYIQLVYPGASLK